jgi:hypothetical protein
MWQRALLALAAFILSFAAHAADVQTDYDTEKDFSQFHYYDWQTQTDNVDSAFNTLSADQLKDLLAYSLDRQLMQAGAQHPADFLVRYYIKQTKKAVDDRPQLGVGVGGFNDNMGGGVSFSFPLGNIDLDTPAQIIIDFLDPKTQQLVWRGSMMTSLSSKSTQANQTQLQKVFDEILKKFPPEE